MFKGKNILIVDDDPNIRRSLQVALKNVGFNVSVAQEVIQAFQKIQHHVFDAFIFDVCLGELSGIDLFRKVLDAKYETPVVFMSGDATLSDAVKAVRMGAFDFLEKPFSPEKLMITLDRLFEYQKVRDELNEYRETYKDSEFIGESKGFKNVLKQIKKVAPTNSPVLIEGETGTGKELIAKQIHLDSKVFSGTFVKVNCSAVPENLFESEFFGYEKGAFTGAAGPRKGYFEQANGGTLLLDEIGELPVSSQAKLLRTLQNHEVQRLGSEKSIKIQVRLVASTNKNLKRRVEQGRFREDLYFRLNVFPISSIPLRDRKKDIPLLSDYFLRQYLLINKMPKKFLEPTTIKSLSEYSWPGNVRELKNTIERIAIMGGQTIFPHDLPAYVTSPGSVNSNDGITLKDFKNKMEREFIVKTIVQSEGNISEAATKLGIERTYLHRKIQQYEIKKKEFFF